MVGKPGRLYKSTKTKIMFDSKKQKELVAGLKLLEGFRYQNFYCTDARIKRRWWLFGPGQIELRVLCTEDFTTQWHPVDDSTASAIVELDQRVRDIKLTAAVSTAVVTGFVDNVRTVERVEDLRLPPRDEQAERAKSLARLQPKTVSTHYYNSPFTSVLFRNANGDCTYCYGLKYASSEVGGPVRLSGLCVEDCDDRWFVFYVDDCAFPPMYAVNAPNFEEAHENFLDECEHLVMIEPEDRHEFNCGEVDDPAKPACNFNSRGTPCILEGVNGFEVWVKEARV
jgi:hypothetical protein